MTTAFALSPAEDRDWKVLYRAAIFEKDGGVIPERISQAEQAVLARGREIFYGGGTREERNALDHALHALRAFRRTWEKAHAA